MSPDAERINWLVALALQREENANSPRSASARHIDRFSPAQTSKKKTTPPATNRPLCQSNDARHIHKKPKATREPSSDDSGFSETAITDHEQTSNASSQSSSTSFDPSNASTISSAASDAGLEHVIDELELPKPQISGLSESTLLGQGTVYNPRRTDITLQDADTRTVPPIGPELLARVQTAKNNSELPRQLDSESVRLVDGKLLYPEKCDSCQKMSSKSRSTCDRAYPCTLCKTNGKSCNPRTYMERARKPNVGRMKTKSSTDSRKTSGTGKQVLVLGREAQHLTAPHVGQGNNGAWKVTEQKPHMNGLANLKRKSPGTSQDSDALPVQKRQVLLKPSNQATTSGLQLGQPKQNNFDDMDLYRIAAPNRRVQAKGSRSYIPYHKSEQTNLPDPLGKPPVWASKRQQLCETLPYYRAYMSGGYIHEGVVYAFLIDKEVGKRDVFDEEVVITRCGGGRTLDEETGKMRQATDQEKSTYGLGFERAKNMGNPIVLIAGQGNWKSPSKLPHYYNILDWFQVTEVWVEKLEGFKTWCVRLEKIRLEVKSWWARFDSAPLDSSRDLKAFKAPSAKCHNCQKPSKLIFNAGWTCLNTSCSKYFIFDSPVDDDSLSYTDAFLKERTPYSGKPLGPLAPPLITEANMITADNSGTEASFKQGIVCPRCNGCSRRTEWARWSCETPGCGFTYTLPIRTISVADAMANKGGKLHAQMHEPKFGVTYDSKIFGAYNVFEYGVPGPDGQIAGVLRHFKSNNTINHQPDGPNDLFRLMQERDFDLRRRPVRGVSSSGEIITNHFATNWGAPYKFVVAQSTRGFNEAPAVIIKALKRLTWAGEQTLTDVNEPFHPFNELLSIGYFEDCHIGYHDDGESTLGPTVATLSLGSQAIMSLRPKAKAMLGNLSRNAKGTKSAVLRVALEHGDIVIMHGSGVQQYYEHEVVPNGKLRFALTCRYVRPETMANDFEREEAKVKGALPEGHEQFNYNGDIDAVFTPLDFEKDEKSERINAAKRMVNDFAVLCKAGESQGDVEELTQMRALLGEFANLARTPDEACNRQRENGQIGQPSPNTA